MKLHCSRSAAALLAPQLLAAVLAASLPGPLAAQLPTQGPIHPVNLTTDGDQAAAGAATAATGATLVVWSRHESRLLARRLDPQGVPVGGEIEVRPEGPNRFIIGPPAVAGGPGGGWTVAWAEWLWQADLSFVLTRRLDASGAPVGEAVELVEEPDRIFGPPAVAVHGTGWTSVIWQTSDGGIAARFLDPGGLPTGGAVPVAAAGGSPAVAATGEGFLLGWIEGLQEGDPLARILPVDPAGNPLGPVRRVSGAAVPPALALLLAGGGGEEAIAVWAGRDPESELEGVWGRLLAPDGSSEGPAVRLDLDRSRRNLLAALAAVPGAGYLAAWRGPAGGPGGVTGFGLVGRFVASGEGPAGPELELVPASDEAVFDAALAGGPGLAATAVWSSCLPRGFVQPGGPPCTGGGDGDGTGLFARRFEGPAGGALQLAPGPLVLGEGARFATVTVNRLGSSAGLVTVEIATADLPGGARAGLDYQGLSVTLVWPDGDGGPKTLEIPILEDAVGEGDEDFRVELGQPTGGAALGDPSEITFTLLDNDAVGETVDDPLLADLAPGESACDGERLAGFFERLTLDAPGSANPVAVNLALSASGDFAGIATTGNGPDSPEHHLAFSTNPDETPLLRNPERPQLVTVGLTRNHLASDLVPPDDRDRLTLILNPTLAAEPHPAALLRIDNRADAVGRPADAKPGRRLLALAEPCHGRLGRADVHVLRVLQKVVRAETLGAVRQAIALYPGTEPGSYRIDVYPRDASGEALGRLAAEITVELVSAPRPGAPPLLDTGELRVLPPCGGGADEAGCTDLQRETTLHLVRPLFRGIWLPTPYRVTVGPGGPEAPVPTVPVSWGDLLGATTWLPVF